MDKNLVIAIKKLIIEAGDIAINARKNGITIHWKSDGSPVTNADQLISDYIFAKLSDLRPDIPIICEEREIVAIDHKKEFWLIDPIDGTRSFINNENSFTVNIALINNRQATYGFIYQPTEKILYYTDKIKKLRIEKDNIIIEQNKHNQNGLVAVVSSNHFNNETIDYLKNNKFEKVIAIPSSLKLCLIAEGAGDVFPKFGTTMEWDIAAGHALIKAAGGEIYISEEEVMLYAKKDFQNSNFIAMNKKFSI